MKLFIYIICFTFFAKAQENLWEKLKGPLGARVYSLIAQGDTLVAGVGDWSGSIFYSTNNGIRWNKSSLKINRSIRDFVFTGDGGIIAAAENSGLYKSYDLQNWGKLTNANGNFWALGRDADNVIYAGSGGSIYLSTDNGVTWELSLLSNFWRIEKFHLIDTTLYAGNYKTILKKSGSQWISYTFSHPSFFKPFSKGDTLYAHSSAYLFSSTDQGESWTQLDTNSFFLFGNYIRSMIYNQRIIAGCREGFSSGYGIALSDDGGHTWRWENTGLPPLFSSAYALATSDDNTYVGTISAGVFKSTNFGDNWFPINEGLTATETKDICFDRDDNIYAACWSNGFQKSTDNGKTWEVINDGLYNSFCQAIISDNSDILYGGTEIGTFRSTDKGKSWHWIFGRMFPLYKDNQDRIYGIVFDYGIYRSSDQGLNWERIDNNFSSLEIFSFAIDSSGNLYAGTSYGWINKSTDDGQSWFPVRQGTSSPNLVTGISVSPNGYIFASTWYDGILRSTDGGSSWQNINNGIPWYIVNTLEVNSKGEVFASFAPSTYVGSEEKIYFSDNNGESWQNITSNLNNLVKVWNIVFDKDDLAYLATDESLWRLNKDVTSNTTENNVSIEEFQLNQNYPNPFNPSTKISYSLKEEGYVKLLIYDIKGELISTLVNEKQQSGNYEVDFTLPGSVSTGVYIYRLTVTDNSSRQVFAEVKKMVYLK